MLPELATSLAIENVIHRVRYDTAHSSSKDISPFPTAAFASESPYDAKVSLSTVRPPAPLTECGSVENGNSILVTVPRPEPLLVMQAMVM